MWLTSFLRGCISDGIEEHFNDVKMGVMASQITSLTSFYSTVYSGVDQRKHQSSASLAFVWGIHRGPVNSPHKWPVTRKMFPFDDVIMKTEIFPRSPAVANHNSKSPYTPLRRAALAWTWNSLIFIIRCNTFALIALCENESIGINSSKILQFLKENGDTLGKK